MSHALNVVNKEGGPRLIVTACLLLNYFLFHATFVYIQRKLVSEIASRGPLKKTEGRNVGPPYVSNHPLHSSGEADMPKDGVSPGNRFLTDFGTVSGKYFNLCIRIIALQAMMP